MYSFFIFILLFQCINNIYYIGYTIIAHTPAIVLCLHDTRCNKVNSLVLST
uniref:Uncharacterized protein n=1 Tax=Histiona aroides TaxID=392300 RepID=M4Q9D5_HISAR|nr:hypothetical protein L075_p071 [Histiona aroides]AGH24032.1 hypothetical protein [Histiona aroides]